MLLMLLSWVAPAAMPIQPAVHVVWNDPYALYPAAGHADLSYEVASLFERNGLDVRFHVALRDRPITSGGGPRVNVIASPGSAGGFGLDEGTMAVAVGERGRGFTIFVFLSAVRATLGHDVVYGPTAVRPDRPRELEELSRAVGRVVAHELIHVLAPERGHARSGLMRKTLTRKLLLGPEIELDAASRRMALDRLKRLASVSASRREHQWRTADYDSIIP